MTLAAADRTAADHRPTAIASIASVLLASGAAILVGGSVAPTRPILLVAFGIALVAGGATERFDDTTEGWVLTGVGALFVLGAFLAAGAASADRLGRVVLYPALVGVTVLGIALRPVRDDWAAVLATTGAGLVFAAVLLAGVTRVADRFALLLGTVGVVAAWDAARYATTLGQQVGRTATTHRAEVVHVAATLLVGAVFVALAETAWAVGVTGLPLAGLLVFLGAAVAFLIVLYA